MSISKKIRKYTKSVSKSLFLKFFLAYTVISIIMVIMIGFFTRFYILKNLDYEIEKFEQKKVNETLNTMDIQFEEMKKLSLNHAINTKLLQFAYVPRSMVPEKQAEVKNVQELLANSINSSNYVTDICVYYEKGRYLLDNGGVTSLDNYYDNAWYEAYDQMTGSEAILETRKVKNRAALDSYTYDNIITFLTKIPYGGGSRDGVIILNVNESLISDMLKNITQGDDQALAFVVNDKGTILSSNKTDYIYADIAKLINMPSGSLDKVTGNFDLTYQDTKMVSYFDSSSVSSWKLFYIVSKNKIFEKSASIRNITVIILAVLLLIMTAVSLLFSFKLYNPIKSIINNIKNMSVANDDNLSDISMIQGEIVKLLENNQLLEKQLEGNKILVRETFLSHLITGRLFNMAEIRSRADYLGILLDFDYYKVVVIQVSPSISNELGVQEIELKKVTFINMVDKLFTNLKIAVEFTRDVDDNILVLLKVVKIADINETEALIEQTLEDIQNSIREYLNLSVSIGIGRVQKSISDIGVSFKEAVEALHYKFFNEDMPVISYTEIAGNRTDMLYYSVEMEQKLITLINLCDYDKTVLVLNEMLENILDYNKSFQHIEVCLSNITGIIQRCIYELNVNIKDVFGEDDQLNPPIDKFKNIQQFKEWISQKFRKIIEYHMDQQKCNTKSLISDVKEYLDDKYIEEISLVTVSSHFNYSPSYFCKTFKEKTGISFWEYVSKIRIEKSKTLLSETNKSIEQIAGLVGYNNRFSYIRTFKKYVAITPGEYRTKYSVKQA